MAVFGLVSAVAGFVKVRYLVDKAVIDNMVFRAHYRITSAILFACCILVCANNLIGKQSWSVCSFFFTANCKKIRKKHFCYFTECLLLRIRLSNKFLLLHSHIFIKKFIQLENSNFNQNPEWPWNQYFIFNKNYMNHKFKKSI